LADGKVKTVTKVLGYEDSGTGDKIMLVVYQLILVVPKMISKILKDDDQVLNHFTFSALIARRVEIQVHKWLRNVFDLNQDALTSAVYYCGVSRGP